ncbi:hypothetical protein [Methylotuvimicrobium sp. KM2]|uniref:hypothetical protein n=1 Tax=Methylotuvimicrobium sp. KM2 TaxID=3133976 RepID=UPI0031016E40
MKTLTLKIDDSVSDKFIWLLQHFSENEVSVVDSEDYLSDDDYLRGFQGMVESIKKAKSEPADKGVTLSQLDW